MTGRAYGDAVGFRTALEHRLRRRAADAGTALDRLRKEVAYQRLLARLVTVAPTGSWALKGGLALVARLDGRTRATKDADATWRQAREALVDVLDDAVDRDLGDFFAFEIAAPRPILAESPEGGLRFPVVARLADREFERLQLDVNLVPGDPRPVETVPLRDLLAFARIPPPRVPMVRVEQHLAEKLHAYCRSYGEVGSSRARDLFDMLVIAERIALPSDAAIVEAGRATFALRATGWPPTVPHPPASWAGAWRGYVRDHGLRWRSLDVAGRALSAFWQPLLASNGRADGRQRWDPERWKWVSTAEQTL